MFRSATTFRIFEEKFKESHKLTAGWTNNFLSRLAFEPITARRLESRCLQKIEESLLDLAKYEVKNLQSFKN